MTVYRYLSLDHGLDTLQNHRLKVGRILELNDPFDCFPRLSEVRNTDQEDVDERAKAMLGPIAQSFGVLCFSATIADPVVWSHYADGHKGIALGFEYHEGERLTQVNYQPIRASLAVNEITEAQKSGNPMAVMDVLSRAFTVKAESWKYEQEYRIFVMLDSCHLAGRHYFQLLPTIYLREVVIGARSPIGVTDIQRCLGDDARYPRGINVVKTRMSRSSYRIVTRDELE